MTWPLASTPDGKLYASGYQTDGNLGLPSSYNGGPWEGVALAGTGWVEVVGIKYFGGVARKSDGTIWSWGTNEQGVLGVGNPTTTFIQYEPVQIGSATNWVRLFAGWPNQNDEARVFALNASGDLYFWGVDTRDAGSIYGPQISPVLYATGMTGLQSIAASGQGEYVFNINNAGTRSFKVHCGWNYNGMRSFPFAGVDWGDTSKQGTGGPFSFTIDWGDIPGTPVADQFFCDGYGSWFVLLTDGTVWGDGGWGPNGAGGSHYEQYFSNVIGIPQQSAGDCTVVKDDGTMYVARSDLPSTPPSDPAKQVNTDQVQGGIGIGSAAYAYINDAGEVVTYTGYYDTSSAVYPMGGHPVIQLAAVNNSPDVIALGGTFDGAGPPLVYAWEFQASPANINWSEVAWSPALGLFCAVATSSVVAGQRAATSPDGITWTMRTISGFNFSSIEWDGTNNLFTAYPNDGSTTFTSPDGITWTARLSAGTWSTGGWTIKARAHHGTTILCNGETNVNAVWRSTNGGISFATRTMPLSRGWRRAAYSPSLSRWVAVAGNGSFGATTFLAATSDDDGLTWTSRTTPATYGMWQDVIWVPELALFVAVGGTFNGGAGVIENYGAMTSPDGITWTFRTTPKGVWSYLAWSPELGKIFATGFSLLYGGKVMMVSEDGINWTEEATPAPQRGWWGIAYSPALIRFVTVAPSGTGDRMMAYIGSEPPVEAPIISADWSFVYSKIGRRQLAFDVSYAMPRLAPVAWDMVYGGRLLASHDITYDVQGKIRAGHDVSYGISSARLLATHDIKYALQSIARASIDIAYSMATRLRAEHAVSYSVSAYARASHDVSWTMANYLRASHDTVYDVRNTSTLRAEFSFGYANLTGSVQTYDTAPVLYLNGEQIEVHDIEVSQDEGGYTWEATITLAHPQDFPKFRFNQPFTVDFLGEAFSLVVDSRAIDRSEPGAVAFKVYGRSPVVNFLAPRSLTLRYTWPEMLASEIAQQLVPGVEWRIIDWVVDANIFGVQNAYPLDALKKLAEAAGGVVESEPDGTAYVRYKHPVSVPLYGPDTATHQLSDTLDHFTYSEKYTSNQLVDLLAIMDEQALGSQDRVEYAPDNESGPSLSGVISVYPNVWRDTCALLCTGGFQAQIEYLGVVEKTIENEALQVVAGKATAANPITEILSHTWGTVDLGTPKADFYSTQVLTQVADDPANGVLAYSMLKLTYKTQCHQFRVAGGSGGVQGLGVQYVVKES